METKMISTFSKTAKLLMFTFLVMLVSASTVFAASVPYSVRNHLCNYPYVNMYYHSPRDTSNPHDDAYYTITEVHNNGRKLVVKVQDSLDPVPPYDWSIGGRRWPTVTFYCSDN